MWRWRSMLVQNLRLRGTDFGIGMGFSVILFLTLNLALALAPVSSAAPTSLGPTSAEEARILWEDGQTSYLESRFQDAINQLGRYVDRYPGATGFLEAHYLLGKSYFELNKMPEALRPLKYYVNSKGISPQTAEARVWLGRTYLALKKFQETLQICFELDQTPTPFNPDVPVWKLILKARALVGLGHEARAESAAQAAEQAASESTPSPLKGQIYAIQLQIKTLSCSHLQAKTPLDENQALSLNDRRGICLQEALLIFNKVLMTQDSTTSLECVTYLKHAFTAYRVKCSHPPYPRPLADHQRTPEELKSYQTELADRLVKNYNKTTLHSLELLTSWKPPSNSPAYPAFLELSNFLTRTTPRTPLSL